MKYFNLRTVNTLYCLVFAMIILGFISCKTVKEYQKTKLNDAEMNLSSRKIEKTELNFQSYREGASGANGGKTGGGCGCN
ncbi:DUF4266 domain-containing protein [Pollutibacter soli]|uniref:DUF4266 domain-containing protein n=1 Tax=Pollutibacter soli TaxID=3034157 RepID=UPI003013C6D6